MTLRPFEILMNFFLLQGYNKTDYYNDVIQVDKNTLKAWAENPTKRKKISSGAICKNCFYRKDEVPAYDLINSFLSYLRHKGIAIPEEIKDIYGGINIDQFAMFFDDFIQGNVENLGNPQLKLFDGYTLPPFFIERFSELNELMDKAFVDGRQVHHLFGEDGLGKSTLANVYAKTLLENPNNNAAIKYIIFVEYSSSLEETVVRIETNQTSPRDNELLYDFSYKINYLSQLNATGQTLLIIDHYTNEHPNLELQKKNRIYKELLNTGCKILFISSTNLTGVYGVDNNVTFIKRMETDRLMDLFFGYKGDNLDNREDVRLLIDKYLLGNTYLVLLSAQLAKNESSVVNVIKHFETTTVSQTPSLVVQENGKRRTGTIIDLYTHVLSKLRITKYLADQLEVVDEQDICGVLCLLALLPTDGIKKKDFMLLIKDRQLKNNVRMINDTLINNSLLFYSNERIFIQPIIKEYLIDQMPDFCNKYVFEFLKNLTNEPVIDTFYSGLLDWLNIEIESIKIFKNCIKPKEKDFNERLAYLAAKTVATYNTINWNRKAFNFAQIASELMYLIEIEYEGFTDQTRGAYSYNVVAYAYLHSMSTDQSKLDENYSIAEKYIEKAEESVNRIVGEKDAIKSTVISTKAAYWLKKKEYFQARKCHQEALKIRKNLEQSAVNEKKKTYKRMLAYSYRGIATDYYYLAKNNNKEERIKYLKKSYDNNEKSVRLFSNLYGIKRLETVTGINRLIGSGIQLIVEKYETVTDEEANNYIQSFYGYLEEVFSFYEKCAFALDAEINDSLKRVMELTDLMKKSGKFNQNEKNFNDRVVKKIESIPNLNSECIKLCSEINKL